MRGGGCRVNVRRVQRIFLLPFTESLLLMDAISILTRLSQRDTHS